MNTLNTFFPGILLLTDHIESQTVKSEKMMKEKGN